MTLTLRIAARSRVLVRTLYPTPASPRLSLRSVFQNHPHRLSSTVASSSSTPSPESPSPSLFRRALSVVAIGVVCTVLGFTMAAAPVISAANGIARPPTDEETLAMYVPETEFESEIDEFINSTPLALEMRAKPEFSESRPHMRIPPSHRSHNLTAGTLLGPGRVDVPPVVWAEAGGKSLVSITHVGSDLCGHPGLVHGGFLATMLDEGMARCCFAALPHNIGVTANLNINYRAPAPASSYIVLKATTTKVEGRKAWVEGRIETLPKEGEEPIVLVDATALFISPKHAAVMTNVFPSS